MLFRSKISISVAQISNMLSQVFSAVGHLTLKHEVYSQSSEEHRCRQRGVAALAAWRKLLRSFSNVKTALSRNFLEGLEEGEVFFLAQLAVT